MNITNYKLKIKSVRHTLFFIFSFSLLSFISCQKVINVDLNSASPAIVIVGNVNDQSGPYIVTLNQTVNFSQNNTFPPISSAFITISDDMGTIDTLAESIPGTYKTTKIAGAQGHTYTLKVIANGQTYISTCTMPQKVNFDTLVSVKQFRFRDTAIYPMPVFLDPGNSVNYYHFVETRNDSIVTRMFTINDQFDNGKFINYTMRSDTSLHIGDTVRVEMQCIDLGAYNYFSTFRQASGSTNVTPYNPLSNISNNALGYFSAHTSQTKGIRVK